MNILVNYKIKKEFDSIVVIFDDCHNLKPLRIMNKDLNDLKKKKKFNEVLSEIIKYEINFYFKDVTNG